MSSRAVHHGHQHKDVVRQLRRRFHSGCPEESGAVIILMAVLVVAIFGFVALAVDLYMFSAQKVKYEETVEQASLAALREYLTAKGLGKPDAVAKSQAIAVAEQLVSSNIHQDFTSRFLINTSAPVSDLGSGHGSNGELAPGHWDFEGASTGACSGINCFTPSTADSSTDTNNAVRVALRVVDGTRLRAFFAGVIGAEQQGFEVAATAAIVPRRIIFAIDLSRSIVRDNYRSTDLPLPTGDPDVDRIPPSEYAYDMTDATPAECETVSPLSYHTAGMASADAITYGNMFDSPDQVGTTLASNAQMHLKSEYKCFVVPSLPSAKYALNVNPDKAPEPLTSILDGINGGLKTLASAGIPGNRIGMIAFDDEILPVRTFAMSPATTGNPEFERMKEATDITLSINQRVQYMLFPRYWGGRQYSSYNAQTNQVEFQRMPAMTDLYKALDLAYTMLSENGGLVGSRNDVVLFSDGLHNCPVNAAFSLDSNFPCMDSDIFVERALAEIGSIRARYIRDGIVLHTLLAGDNVGPHYLLRKNARGGGCLWPEIARYDRSFGRSMVNYHGGSMTKPPYYRPNYLYLPVVDSGGMWSPLVDPCVEGQDLTTSLNEQCDNQDGAHGKVVAVPPYTDRSGRLGCNAKGKTKRQQVEDLIRSLISQTPYVLVE
ncbi:MAG: TadG family pilus assembly protein [Bdellovibrionota bacterium]